MHKHIALLGAFLLAAASAGAQTIMVSAEQARAAQAVESACNHAWSSMMRASLERHLMHIDDAHTAQVSCFLKTLSTTTFASYDSDFDQSYVDSYVRGLLYAYAPSDYGYFANQIEVFPGRVQHGLLSALLNVGDPKATRMYFEAKHAPAQAQPLSRNMLDYYRVMVEGRCHQVGCSPRFAESVAIVRANLDVVETELRATLMLTAQKGASVDELNRIAAVHRDAQGLIETVHRVR